MQLAWHLTRSIYITIPGITKYFVCAQYNIVAILTHATSSFLSGIFRSIQESENIGYSRQQGAKSPGTVAWECIGSCSHSKLQETSCDRKISVKDGSTFDIEYLKESWRKEWKSWKLANGEKWVYTACTCWFPPGLEKKKSRTKLTNTSERHIRIWKEISQANETWIFLFSYTSRKHWIWITLVVFLRQSDVVLICHFFNQNVQLQWKGKSSILTNSQGIPLSLRTIAAYRTSRDVTVSL